MLDINEIEKIVLDCFSPVIDYLYENIFSDFSSLLDEEEEKIN